MGTTDIPTFAGQAAAAEAAKNTTPTTPEGWLNRMTDFTRNMSAFRDPKVFVPWSNAVTEPGFYVAMMNGMMDPGGWLNMMNSMAHPDAVRNYLQFTDPNILLKWTAATMDPNFSMALLSQLSDPGKLMRWAMLPADPKLWNVFLNTLNPNTYIRWGMSPLDPRAWNLAGTMANPALYTGMLGAVINPYAYGQGTSSWLTWKPAPSVQGAGSFAMWDPVAMLGNLSGWIPGMEGVSLPQLPQIGLPSFPTAPIQIPTPMLPPVSAPAQAPVAKPAAPVAAPVAVPAPQAMVAPTAPEAPAANKVVLAGDALFKLGKSGIRDLSKDGKAKLDEVVAKLKGMGEIDQIKVVGHADPTGNAKSNMRLSEARAKSIKSYLIAKGIKPNVIITSGMGDTQPVVQCAADLPKAELRECHAPNRRVEIEIVAKPK
jgi:outer membrane protein OmpA-like peptidoglycan-associated protein